MQTSQDNSKSKSKSKKNEKKVSLGAVEAIERTTDSIERLASLMDKPDNKLEEKISIGPEFIKLEVEVMATDKISIVPEIGLIAETGIKITIEEEETTIEVVIETIDPTTGIVVGPETETITEMGIGTIMDQIIEEMTITRGMEIEIGTRVGLEKGIEIGVVQEKVSNPEVATNLGIRVEMIVGDSVGTILETDLNLDQEQAPM